MSVRRKQQQKKGPFPLKVPAAQEEVACTVMGTTTRRRSNTAVWSAAVCCIRGPIRVVRERLGGGWGDQGAVRVR